jgi:Rod binding domain-containing protein
MLTGIPVDALIGAGAAPLLAETTIAPPAPPGSALGPGIGFQTLLADQLSTLAAREPLRAQADAQPAQPAGAAEASPEQLAEIEDAARQFEALLLYTLLKQMWVSVPEGTLFGQSHAAKFYREMWLEALADEIATAGPGLGIAPVLERQLLALSSSSPTFAECAQNS